MTAEPRSYRLPWLVLLASLLVQMALAPATGWERDQYWFATWMRTALEHGVARVSLEVWCDYPPGYLYVLEVVGRMWTALTGASVPADDTLALRLLLKLVPILTNLATAWLLYLLALAHLGEEPSGRRRALAVLAAYAFNPAMLFVSAVWGQVDSVVSLFALLAVWALCRKRFALAFGIFAATVLIKLQAVVLLPLFVLVAVRLGGAGALFAAVRGGALVAFVLLLPYFAAERTESLLATMLGASGRYPYLSMNAHNVWWLLAGAKSPMTSDSLRIGNGLLTYRNLGTLMLGATTLLVLWRLWRESSGADRPMLRTVCTAAALQLLAFYLFPTEMHERYLLPAIVFLAASCIWRPGMWWAYGVVSVAATMSLASTLHVTYPNGMGGFGAFFPADRADVYGVSAVFVALFPLLLLWGADRRFKCLAPAATGLVAAGVACLVFVPLHGSVALSSWEPVEQSQGWGTLEFDRSVGSQRLSARGLVFRHGLGTHAVSRLTYHLNGNFRIFETAFAVDDEANRAQMIRFRILCDDAPCFDSGDVSASGLLGHARTPVDGVEFLTLEVLDGGDGINSDHADWLEPVLLR